MPLYGIFWHWHAKPVIINLQLKYKITKNYGGRNYSAGNLHRVVRDLVIVAIIQSSKVIKNYGVRITILVLIQNNKVAVTFRMSE